MGHGPHGRLHLITEDPEQELYDLTAWVTTQRLMGRIPDEGYASLMGMIEEKAREIAEINRIDTIDRGPRT